MFIIWYQFRFPHGFQIRSPWSRKTRGALQLGKPEIHRIQEAGVWPDPACQILPHLLSCCPGPGQIGAAAVRGFGGEWCFQHSVFCDISCDTETLPYIVVCMSSIRSSLVRHCPCPILLWSVTYSSVCCLLAVLPSGTSLGGD